MIQGDTKIVLGLPLWPMRATLYFARYVFELQRATRGFPLYIHTRKCGHIKTKGFLLNSTDIKIEILVIE